MMRYKCFLTNDPAEIERTLVNLQEQTGMAPLWPPVITPAVNLSGGYVYVAIGYMDNAPPPPQKTYQPAPIAAEPEPARMEPMPMEAPPEYDPPTEERQSPKPPHRNSWGKQS